MNREDFPMLKNDIVYFDNGATSLKPQVVIDAMVDYYTNHTANIHRGDYQIAIKTDELYDKAREKVKEFIKAERTDEIIFTAGTTDSINKVVFGYMENHLQAGDEVLITKAEHASCILPWYRLQEKIGIKVREIPLNNKHKLDVEEVKKMITSKTKVISIAHITNVIGDVRDVEAIGKLCNDSIYFVVDGAQSVSHIDVDVCKMNASFFAFSAHKMLGPTGVGVLYGKKELLDEMDATCFGGGMNEWFESDGSYRLREVPIKFEAGTPPIAEVIGLLAAIEYIEKIGVENIHQHELQLKKYLLEELAKIDNITVYNEDTESAIVAFNIDGVFSQDTAIYLSHYNICVRAGNHCSKILKDEINIKNTCRISMHLYNTKKDIDKLIRVLKDSKDIFKIII